MIKSSTALLVVGLLLGVVLLATVIDTFAPSTFVSDPGAALHWLRRPTLERPQFGADSPRGSRVVVSLPHASRVLAGIVALFGYGFLLRYLVPRWWSHQVDTLSSAPRMWPRSAVAGLVALLLLATLTFLATLSFVALPLVPLFSMSAALAALTGLVLAASTIGQWLRARTGDIQVSPHTDLLVGLLAVMLIALVPVVGALLLVVVAAAGLGEMVVARIGEVNAVAADPLQDDRVWQ